MSYEIHWEAQGVVKRFWGLVSSNDVIRSVIETESDERFDNLRFVINDFLAVTEVSFDAEDVGDIAVMDLGASKTNPAIKIAIVATTAELIELGNQYVNSPLNVYPTKIFATMSEARAWVLEPSDFRSTRW